MKLSLLRIGTIDAAHCENLVIANIPAACNLSSSMATLSLSANDTCQTLRNQGWHFLSGKT